MIFGGFQKLTLLDYPGKVACTLFTIGCNLRCPFCHNAFLVEERGHQMIEEEEILEYLKKRKGIIEGVCISGGEPLIHSDIESFMIKLKEMNLSVKLDTNGSFPKRMKHLADRGLIDYVAMDVKNTPQKYGETTGCDKIDISAIKESIDFLMSSKVDYEFRTTVADGLHTVGDITELSLMIKGAKRFYIQNFADSGNILGDNLSPISVKTLLEMKKAASENVENTFIRGMDV